MAIGQDVGILESVEKVWLRAINLSPKVDSFQSLVPGVVIMAIFLGALTKTDIVGSLLFLAAFTLTLLTIALKLQRKVIMLDLLKFRKTIIDL